MDQAIKAKLDAAMDERQKADEHERRTEVQKRHEEITALRTFYDVRAKTILPALEELKTYLAERGFYSYVVHGDDGKSASPRKHSQAKATLLASKEEMDPKLEAHPRVSFILDKASGAVFVHRFIRGMDQVNERQISIAVDQLTRNHVEKHACDFIVDLIRTS